MSTPYKSEAARSAQRAGYGDKSYWDYLDQHAQELRDKFAAGGDTARAEQMMTRDVWESVRGNEGA